MATGDAAVIRALLLDLLTPDDQRADWYAWATNQAAHGALVGMPAALLLLGIGCPAGAVPVTVAVVYGLGWETRQIGTTLADSLSDTAHVAVGATLVTSALLWGYWPTVAVLAVWALMIATGIWRRLPRC